MRRLAATLVLATAIPLPIPLASAQAPDGVPPPGEIVETTREWSLGAGIAALGWDDDAPYEDLALASVSIERALWPGVRGRGAMAYGTTDFRAAGRFGDDLGPEAEAGSVRVWSFDLQVLLEPWSGPFADLGVSPYALGGVGAIVTDFTDAGGLATRNQSQWSYGAGVRARLGPRFELRAEGASTGLRLADPFDIQNQDSDTIHNTRWEGQVRWTF